MEGDGNQCVNMDEPISSDSDDKQAFRCSFCAQGNEENCQHTVVTIASWRASRGWRIYEPQVEEPRGESISSSDDDDAPQEGCVTEEENLIDMKGNPKLNDEDLEFWSCVPSKGLRALMPVHGNEAEGNAASTLDLTATSEPQPSSSAVAGPSGCAPKRPQENANLNDEGLKDGPPAKVAALSADNSQPMGTVTAGSSAKEGTRTAVGAQPVISMTAEAPAQVAQTAVETQAAQPSLPLGPSGNEVLHHQPVEVKSETTEEPGPPPKAGKPADAVLPHVPIIVKHEMKIRYEE